MQSQDAVFEVCRMPCLSDLIRPAQEPGAILCCSARARMAVALPHALER